MKTCPFCAEEIQDAAIKCKHCSEFLDGSRRPGSADDHLPWYFKNVFIIIALLSVGPLALPLIWWHPQMSRVWKISLTIGIVIFSWLLYLATMKSLQTLQEYYKLLNVQ